jgi:hypothetical protein
MQGKLGSQRKKDWQACMQAESVCRVGKLVMHGQLGSWYGKTGRQDKARKDVAQCRNASM